MFRTVLRISCIVLLAALLLVRADTSAPASVLQDENPAESAGMDADTEIKNLLTKYLGIKYRRGGVSTRGFDCSGFARFIYRNVFGFDLPHGSSSQYRSSLLARVPRDELQAGDLIFFASTPSKKRINHVGIYLDGNRFIHAELRRGIVISCLDDRHWKSRMVSTKRPVSLDDMGREIVESDITDEPGKPGSAYSPPSFHAGLLKTFSLGVNCGLSFSLDYSAMRDSSISHAPVSVFDEVRAPGSAYHLAAAVMPLPGLYVAPVLSWYDHGRTIMDSYYPDRAFGISVLLYPMDGRPWSAAATLQQSMFPDAPGGESTADDRSYDWRVTCSRRLSDSVLFSLTGEHVRTPFLSGAPDNNEYDRRFFLNLHFSY